MEKRIMRKHLIGTILVLAAFAACNKEVETPAPVVDNGQEEVTPGKVTLTFKAAIDEETRTTYENDQIAHWAKGDAISVRVTDGKNNYQTAVFTTEDGETFSGQVSAEYTTIVSGVYPAHKNHVFSGGSVQSVYLKDTYDLGTANDEGTALPMVGEMKNGAFTFHHICGALKIEVVDIFNALTFTTAGEPINGLFPLNEDGRIAIETATSTGPSTVTFNYDRLSTNPVDDERNNRTFFIPIPDGTLSAGATMALKNANKTSTFFDKTTTADIEFTSNKIKRLPAIEFVTPEGWSLEVHEVDSGNPVTIDNNVPSGTKFVRWFMKKSTFESTYQGSIAQFAELKIPDLNGFSGQQVYTTGSNIEAYFNETYVEVICGVNKTAKSGRHITFEYCIIEWEFEEPTQAYLDWIGKWSVSDVESTDTWTITRKQANKTYTVTGLCNNTTNPKKVEAIFNDGKLKFMSQFDFASFTGASNGKKYQLSLVMVNSSGAPQYNNYVPYSIMQASKPNEGSSTLSKLQSNFSRYNLIAKQTHESTSYSPYGTARKLPATMTRVTETE